MNDLHGFTKKCFAALPCSAVIQKHMQGKQVLVSRINTVSRETAAETIGAVVHWLHTLNNLFSGHTEAFFRDDSGDRTAGWNSDLTFNFIHVTNP